MCIGLVVAWLPAAPIFDISSVKENDPGALATALEEAGGKVGGLPMVVMADGPDGKSQRLIEFPDPASFVMWPLNSNSQFYKTSVSIFVDEMPFTKAGGAIFGVLFGQNDSVLALTCGKWDQVQAASFGAGFTTLVEKDEVKESQFPMVGDWQKAEISREAMQWGLTLWTSASGEPALKKTGEYTEDERSPFSRKPPLWIKVGTFRGMATVPDFAED